MSTLIFVLLNLSAGAKDNGIDRAAAQETISQLLSGQVWALAFNAQGGTPGGIGNGDIFILNVNNGIIPLSTALKKVLESMKDTQKARLVNTKITPDSTSNLTTSAFQPELDYLTEKQGWTLKEDQNYYDQNGNLVTEKAMEPLIDAANVYVADFVAHNTEMHTTLNLYALQTVK